MKITLNGKAVSLDAESTVAELLEQKGVRSPLIIVEINKTVIERGDYAVYKMADGDIVEVVQLMGGG